MATKDTHDKDAPKPRTHYDGRFGYQPTTSPANPKPPQGGSVTLPPPPKSDAEKK